jgi:hypothetical protein
MEDKVKLREAKWMYLDCPAPARKGEPARHAQKARPGLLLTVPHRREPMSVRELEKAFPDFAKLFDGQSEENTILFYWKRNKDTKVYEFREADDEEEVAELMGVECFVETETDGEPEKTDLIGEALGEEEMSAFKSHMDDIKKGLAWLNHDG